MVAWRSTSSSAEPCAPALAGGALIALLAACQPAQEPLPSDLGTSPVPFDHHVHLLGPRLVADWSSIGAGFSRPAAHYGTASTVLDAAAGARSALLVPMAHLYATGQFAEALGLSEGTSTHAFGPRTTTSRQRRATRAGAPGRCAASTRCAIGPSRNCTAVRHCRQ